jgi:hypothetical protein
VHSFRVIQDITWREVNAAPKNPSMQGDIGIADRKKIIFVKLDNILVNERQTMKLNYSARNTSDSKRNISDGDRLEPHSNRDSIRMTPASSIRNTPVPSEKELKTSL